MIKIEHTKFHDTLIPFLGDRNVELKVAEGKWILAETYSGGGKWIEVNGRLKKPIIISEIEKIEVGDLFLHKGFSICTATQHDVDIQKRVNYIGKVLALPEHFSPKHLQDIVDGKLKDGDKVLVECVLKNINISNNGHLGGYTKENVPFIKLNSSNHITLHKVEEKMVPVSIAQAYGDYREKESNKSVATMTFSKWFEQNVK